MANDWGALFGGLAESGGQAFESARNFRFMAAQAALQQQLRQQGMALSERETGLAERDLEMREAEAARKLAEADQITKDIETFIGPEPQVPPSRHPGVRGAVGRQVKPFRQRAAGIRLGMRAAPERVLFPEQEALETEYKQSQIDVNRARMLSLMKPRDFQDKPGAKIEFATVLGMLRYKASVNQISNEERQILGVMEEQLKQPSFLEMLLGLGDGGGGSVPGSTIDPDADVMGDFPE